MNVYVTLKVRVCAFAPIAGLHVLIAEDHEINAEILTAMLETEGATYEWAENGQRP